MTTRDRLVMMAIAVVAVLGAVWFLALSPERKQATKLGTEVSAARSQLAGAEGQLTSAREAQTKYAAAYASIVSLGKAVPPAQEVPSLIYELDRASNEKKVNFFSISAGAGGAPASAAGAAAGASSTGAAPTTFTAMPFTFVFNGSYADLYNLFSQLNRFTELTSSGGLRVNGRLLTIQALNLIPSTSTTGTSANSASTELTGTVTATAYVLPATQGLTGGATPSTPAGSTTQPAAATTSSPTAPAIARVNP